MSTTKKNGKPKALRNSKGRFISKSEAGKQMTILEDQTEKKETGRRKLSHQWPKVGTVLTGKYYDMTVRAEVIKDPDKTKPHGKALKCIDDPSLPLAYTMSQAANEFTAKIRKIKKACPVANGWKFWKTKRNGSFFRLFDLDS